MVNTLEVFIGDSLIMCRETKEVKKTVPTKTTPTKTVPTKTFPTKTTPTNFSKKN